MSQHGVCPVVLRGWHPYSCPLPPSLLTPQDPPPPPPLCHLHRCHGDQWLSPSCGVRLSCMCSLIWKRCVFIVQCKVQLIFLLCLLFACQGISVFAIITKLININNQSTHFGFMCVCPSGEGFSTPGGMILCWRSCCFLELWRFIQDSWT